MSSDARLVRALVGCYPPVWRRRYGEEYAQLLCDMQVHRRPRLVADSLLGAARAHGGALMSGRPSFALPVWAAALFAAAGIGFAKLAEDLSGVATTAHAAVIVAAAVALLALAVAAAPAAAALVPGRAADAWRYVAVPIVGAAAWCGVARVAAAATAGRTVHSGPNIAAFALIAVTGLGVLAATAWAATRILQRVPLAGPGRLRGSAVTAMATGMAGATFAVLVWGLRVRATDAAAFHSDQGLLATPFVSSWLAVLIALCAASVLGAVAARHHRTAP
ncbi:hypothetical protein [Micromonospora mirobrigensis]|uniref:Uncharacterized protein n=1 Tax=Micromonospora mirobrigensis TaxID=262898 RepID=A0A1C4W6H9_9ACTN|nr:hypothetical protein [Micromonospora mirobrigensis]SCE91783.1 hypothetical protein GA0070564_10238 [Micromonospora mirobrigensis]